MHLILAFFGANFPLLLRGIHLTTSCVGLNFLSRHLTLQVEPPFDVWSQSIFIAVGSILKYENAFPHRVSAKIQFQGLSLNWTVMVHDSWITRSGRTCTIEIVGNRWSSIKWYGRELVVIMLNWVVKRSVDSFKEWKWKVLQTIFRCRPSTMNDRQGHTHDQ